jgi:hypothetical protein
MTTQGNMNSYSESGVAASSWLANMKFSLNPLGSPIADLTSVPVRVCCAFKGNATPPG